MDSKYLKYILLFLAVVLDHGHLRDSPEIGCRSSRECDFGEYCDGYTRICKRNIIRQSKYPSYHSGEKRKRIDANNYYPNQDQYQQSFDNRDGIGHRRDNSDWFRDKNDYERTREDQNLRAYFPVERALNDETDLDGGPLPPVQTENWDKINAKHGLRKNINLHQGQHNQGYVQDVYETDGSDSDNLNARKHIRQVEDSSYHSDQSLRDQQDSSQNSNFLTKNDEFDKSRQLRDPVYNNIESSSKKSEIRNPEGVSTDDEKVIPPVPLSREIAPDPSDSASFQDNHMQTEKQASREKAADSRAGEGKIMVKGKVKQVKADIDQGPNPEKTYKRVEDFFQSQRESSIVEVPSAVKKEEASKLFKDNFVPVKDAKGEVNKEQVESDNLKEGDIKLSLSKNVTTTQAKILAEALQNALWNNAPYPMFTVTKVLDSNVKLKMAKTKYTLEEPSDVAERIKKEPSVKDDVARRSGLEIKAADYEQTPNQNVKTTGKHPKRSVETQQPKYFLITVIVVGCVTGIVLTAVAIYLMMRRHNEAKSFKPVTLPGQEAAADYQELCRQLRASQGWDSGPVSTTPLQHAEKEKGLGSGRAPKYSWSEEPVVPNMDISTGHVVLSYMEDHLQNKDRLNKEWEALKTYEAEPNSREIGKLEKNARKNRYSDVLPYDHNRVLLKETASATGTDYINASYVMDHDPKNPSYIATQGPLAQTVSDFWQMVWEQGVVVIVNLTKLSDLGLPQCHRYWPEEQQPIITYRIYEVHLVSEHIWCEDYLVRSFYLKNLQTSETRTVTQFHFLSWPDLNVPLSPKPLLEFRRKVNKCFRGRASPVVVHCSGGVGRTGTYILIDMVLNKMMRGAKEIDIAATVEHLRDQRPSMVKTKAQFEFALTAVAEEVNAILQALSK